MLNLLKKFGLVFLVLLVILGSYYWRTQRPLPASGSRLSIGGVSAEILFFEVGDLIKRGPDRIIVLRFLENVEFRPYHYKESGLDGPRIVEEWAKHLKSPLVFNAGQFDEDFEHIGWLKREDQFLSQRFASAWKGLLVSDENHSEIFDLEKVDQTIHQRFPHALQSMMLIDEKGTLRVRDTALNACRTVIAQDRQGRMLLFLTEGAITLGDMGRWLALSPLDIKYAMNLDGGIESQLALRADGLEISVYGQYGTGATVFDARPGEIRYPLPAVLALMPTKE